MGSQTMTGTSTSHIQTLARQGSLYNLTLNEVQSHFAEPLLSMNLDDLLKSIFPDEINQPTPLLDIPRTSSIGTAASTGLQRQGSISMPPSLSKKTIDEVWRGMNRPATGEDQFGEMTLESFLLKAGVVVEDHDNIKANGKSVNTSNFMGNAVTVAAQGHQVYGWNNNGYLTGRVQMGGMGPGTVIDAVSVDLEGERSGSGDGMDKNMERRQKRMIKNRESAARSRARKQAYTNELENKVSRLEEENVRLKKQKVIDKMLGTVPVEAPKYQLRRTSSNSF